MQIECVTCHEKMLVRPDVYAKRIVKFGSEEKLLAEYQCLDCRPKKTTVDATVKAEKKAERLEKREAKKALTETQKAEKARIKAQKKTAKQKLAVANETITDPVLAAM